MELNFTLDVFATRYNKKLIAELRTQLEIASEINYLDKNLYNRLEKDCDECSAMLYKLIKARENQL